MTDNILENMSEVDDIAVHLNPIQAVLQNPDVQIGSTKNTEKEYYVLNDDKTKFISKNIKYNPALINCIKEMQANAIDNFSESQRKNVKMTYIKISVDNESITYENDGRWISAEKRDYNYLDPYTKEIKTEHLYQAEVVFGRMNAGTNYNKSTVNKGTVGKNGVGVKLCNIFSKHFIVEHTDPETKTKLTLEYKNNMDNIGKPIVENYKSKTSYTSVKMFPDFSKFDNFDAFDDLKSMVERMAYDTAVITGLNVYFNDTLIKMKNFDQFIKMFYDKPPNIIHLKSDNSDCYFVENKVEDVFKDSDTVFGVSFVNGLNTAENGAHVDAWSKSIFLDLTRSFNESRKDSEKKVSSKHLMPYFSFFVTCSLQDTHFNNQTKEKLLSPKPNVEKLNELQIKDVLKYESFCLIKERLDVENQKALEKKTGTSKKRISYKEVIEANLAGKKPEECTLFLCEGSSARACCQAIIDNFEGNYDKYGVCALRGKIVNALKESSKTKIYENKEFTMIRNIMGLEIGADYTKDENKKKLRYHHIGTFFDSDVDGHHITSLFINFICKCFPTLLKTDYFTIKINTLPLVRIWKSEKQKSNASKPLSVFYTDDDYKNTQIDHKAKKFYKGLGAFQESDYDFLYEELKQLTIDRLTADDQNALMLSFGDDHADDRKNMMCLNMQSLDSEQSENRNFEPIYNAIKIKVDGVVNIKEILETRKILYDFANLPRSVPKLIDGLKETHRKIIWVMLKEKIFKEEKIAQLKGLIASKSAYEHNEDSIENTINGMTHTFVGSNNIALLYPAGQTGSRYGKDGSIGADAAAGRYTSSYLDPVVSYIFISDDDEILPYTENDGKFYEPHFFLPIIPMILVNGASGIATGYSSNIPNYNPIEIIDSVLCWISKKPYHKQLIPFWRNFKGEVTMIDKNTYTTKGCITKISSSKNGVDEYKIDEIPVDLSILKVKMFLEKLEGRENAEVEKTKKTKTEEPMRECIKDLKCYLPIKTKKSKKQNDNSWNFTFKTKGDFIPDINTKNNMNWMISKGSLKNMNILNLRGRPKKYSSPEEIIDEFCVERIKWYDIRKQHKIKKLEREILVQTNKFKLYGLLANKQLDLLVDDTDILFEKFGFDKVDDSYSYLLGGSITTIIRKTDFSKFEDAIQKLQDELRSLKKTSIEEMWINELHNLRKYIIEKVDGYSQF